MYPRKFQEKMKKLNKQHNTTAQYKSKDYLKGFRHGVSWALLMAKLEVNKRGCSGSIAQGEIASLEISLDNIKIDSKEAIKSLKEGR